MDQSRDTRQDKRDPTLRSNVLSSFRWSYRYVSAGFLAGSVTGYKDVDHNSEQALMSAVAQQPVSIAIEADRLAYMNG